MRSENSLPYAAALANREAQGLLRKLPVVLPIDATHIQVDGKRYVNFASNDYLGLTHHPRMIAAVCDAAERFGVGSGAAGLIGGHTEEHAAAERELSQWKQTQSAILLPSGYQANLAAVQTLAAVAAETQQSIRFVVDQLSHASLIDAVRASGAAWRVFPHNHLGKLGRLLSDARAEQMQVVVSESIFSMDGDAADLAGLSELKREFEFTLLLDEAHGTGAYGADGRGYAAETGHSDIVDISVITLSKALGCIGGAICGGEAFIQSVVNFGRAAIFSTSIPPTVAAAARAGMRILRTDASRQQRLRESARRIRSALSIPGPEDSPIIAIILGEEHRALAASEKLMEAGLWVVAVRPPTVKKGSSRLRITVSSEHTDAEIEHLIQNVKQMI